jgi:phosphopantothenoylcysteine decarboxylase / phosphopantothenate---cysteine ligase
MLQNKKIIIGVCGGIAAYKVAYLIRGFVKEGAEVKVIMTPSAREFITPLTLSTLSKNPVLTDFHAKESGEWTNHVELGLWADTFIIAPATANTIAKCANGICDSLLTAVYLSARCPVFFAPAMDLDMYQHPSVLNNLRLLKAFGNFVIDAEEGELASGLKGVGRLAEPETIVNTIRNFFAEGKELKGKKVLITAGPTYEALDPVRFIGNHSTGKMGYAIADSFSRKGAEVVLISGPYTSADQ